MEKITESHRKEKEEKEEKFNTELKKKEDKLEKARGRYKQAEITPKDRERQIKDLEDIRKLETEAKVNMDLTNNSDPIRNRSTE